MVLVRLGSAAPLALLAMLVGCMERGPAPQVPTQEVHVQAVRPSSSSSPIAAGPAHGAGDRVEVEWQGRWYPAVLLEPRGGDRWLIHYEGYDDSWDEEVGPDRMRAPSDAPADHGAEPEEPPRDPGD